MKTHFSYACLVSEVINYFDRACFTLDSSLHFGVQADFIFRNDTDFEGGWTHFKDNDQYLSRPLYQQKLNHHGPPFTIDLKKNLLWSFKSELTQEIFIEADESNECKNYPNSDYSCYNECDQEYTWRKISAFIGPSFTPLWAATGDSNATEKAVLAPEEKILYEEVCRLATCLVTLPGWTLQSKALWHNCQDNNHNGLTTCQLPSHNSGGPYLKKRPPPHSSTFWDGVKVSK